MSRAWIRGLTWSPIISAMGPDVCGEWQGFEGVTRLMVSHKSSGRVSRACPWSPMVSEHDGRVSRCPVSWSVTASDHERQGLRGCHALGFVVSQHLRS